MLLNKYLIKSWTDFCCLFFNMHLQLHRSGATAESIKKTNSQHFSLASEDAILQFERLFGCFFKAACGMQMHCRSPGSVQSQQSIPVFQALLHWGDMFNTYTHRKAGNDVSLTGIKRQLKCSSAAVCVAFIHLLLTVSTYISLNLIIRSNLAWFYKWT